MTRKSSLQFASRLCVSARRFAISCGFAAASSASFVALMGTSVLLSGCSGTVRTQLGAISVSGGSQRVPQNTTAQLTVLAAGSDPGPRVNWTLSCAGSTVPPATQFSTPAAAIAYGCGTFSPPYTAADGKATTTYAAPANLPIGGTVSVTAALASDPSITATTTLSIVHTPLTISFSTSLPALVGVGTTTLVAAKVTNDDTAQGVNWSLSCASGSNCGSLKSTLQNPTQTASGEPITYTSPATVPAGNGAVTLIATSVADPTVSVSKTFTVSDSVLVSPTAASVQLGSSTTLTGTAFYDPGNLGLDWTISCSASPCGTITPHTASGAPATFTAPATMPTGGSVSVTARSTAIAAHTATATVTLLPAISVAFTGAVPATLTAGMPGTLAATVTNDIGSAGVDWSAACSSAPCGSFSSAHTASGATTAFTPAITAPAGTITITATSTASFAVPAVRSVSTSLTITPVISVSFVPFAPAQMLSTDSTVLNPPATTITAAVANDNTNAGIDWSVCTNIATCGEFQIVPAIAPTATTAASNAVYAATAHTANGQPVFYVPPAQPGNVTLTAKAHNPTATSTVATATAVVQVVQKAIALNVSGTVMAGSHAVSGATVTLYAAGTSGNGSAASNLAQATTSATGTFTIPATYSCPSQSAELYLLAQAGDAGAGSNANLAMMTALGPCGAMNPAVNIIVNEVTTVGSVWTLAPFMSDITHVGSTGSNASNGLANAFAAVNNLVSITSGMALSTTPVGNATVPRAEINTIADILNTCTHTSGGAVGDGSGCGLLFNATNPGAVSSNAATNTVQAALNMAHVPSFDTTPGNGSIFSLLPSTHVFSPTLTTDPNDWTVTLSFTGGGLGARSLASSMAIDGAGNVWITNQRQSSVTELTSLGTPLSPSATGTQTTLLGGFMGAGLSGPVSIAIDPLGNAWIGNNGSLSELPATTATTYSGALPAGGFTGGGLAGPLKGVAIDGAGNVWAVNNTGSGALSWFAGANAIFNNVPKMPGTALSPTAGFTSGLSAPSGAIEVDNAGTVWVMDAGSNSAAQYNSTNGSFIQSDYGYLQATPVPVSSVLSQGVGTGMAIDSVGNAFLSPGTQLAELLAGGSSANAGGLGAASPSIGILYAPFLAVDGSEHLWTLITGGSVNCPAQYSVVELSANGSILNNNYQGCGYVGTGIGASDDAIAVDGSGNLWVLSSGSITEFVGVASPVVTPFSRGVQNKTLGKAP